MHSILAKVLLWSLGTFILSLLAYGLIRETLGRRGPPESDPFWRMVRLIEEDACQAYEEGGPGRLAAHLRRLDAALPGEHFLTDAAGRDLATGEDRSRLLAVRGRRPGPPRLEDGRMVLVGRPRDGRYRFITVVPPWFRPPEILPYYGAIVLVIAGMGSALAIHLARPLHWLRGVVERFGSGDLAARSRATRRDEIGELSRAFDRMADRIETLLMAERRLLQDVSHELRSPLARLGFAVELARTSEDRGAALDRIQKDIDRLNHLVDQLLQLTRLEGDPDAFEPQEVRLDELVRAVADDCAVEAAAKACEVELSVQPARMWGEPELLHRAIENVLRNAVRHAPERTSIEMSLSVADGTAAIAVRDRGAGIPEDYLGAIFEPFVRVDPDRSRASGGVGLGLAIARRAVRLHGGQIRAENAGPGLLVTIALPVQTEE